MRSTEHLKIVDGRVHIRDRHWTPQEILRAFGAADDELYKEWSDDHRDHVLDRAGQILDQYEQRDRFNALKATFKRGQVMPFVGAGLSIPSGYPGWTAFLLRIRRDSSVS